MAEIQKASLPGMKEKAKLSMKLRRSMDAIKALTTETQVIGKAYTFTMCCDIHIDQ